MQAGLASRCSPAAEGNTTVTEALRSSATVAASIPGGPLFTLYGSSDSRKTAE